MEYRCPNCNAVLKVDNNTYICEYCKSQININKKSDIEYIIPFKIKKSDAINIYNKHLKLRLLVPKEFKNKKSIYNIEGVYVPCYLYNLNSTGVVELEGSIVSTWKSSRRNYKKEDIYKITRGAGVEFKDMPIIGCKDINSLAEPYDYKDMKPFNESYIENYKVCEFNKTKEELLSSIQDKTKKIFSSEMRRDLKDYENIKEVDNLVNLYDAKYKSILLPIWVLNINYKSNNYKYIINGQTGKLDGIIIKNKKKLIYIWIFLFIALFVVLLVLSIVKVNI